MIVTLFLLACPCKRGGSHWLRRPCRPSCAEQGGCRTGRQTSQLALAGEDSIQESLKIKTSFSWPLNRQGNILRDQAWLWCFDGGNLSRLFSGIASVRQQWALEARLRRHPHLLRLGPHCCTLHQVGLRGSVANRTAAVNSGPGEWKVQIDPRRGRAGRGLSSMTTWGHPSSMVLVQPGCHHQEEETFVRSGVLRSPCLPQWRPWLQMWLSVSSSFRMKVLPNGVWSRQFTVLCRRWTSLTMPTVVLLFLSCWPQRSHTGAHLCRWDQSRSCDSGAWG